MKRFKVSRKRSKSMFRKTSRPVSRNRQSTNQGIKRGGYRL